MQADRLASTPSDNRKATDTFALRLSCRFQSKGIGLARLVSGTRLDGCGDTDRSAQNQSVAMLTAVSA